MDVSDSQIGVELWNCLAGRKDSDVIFIHETGILPTVTAVGCDLLVDSPRSIL